MYRDYYNGTVSYEYGLFFKIKIICFLDDTLEFPKKYPTGCLLGCVTVEDCLDQNEYRKRYPNGESNSPYVLMCSNPVILPVFYPMQGQHKICEYLTLVN